ncbi:hypothetical protein [Streptomyces sp. CC224B]|nr:hypothetical protein [Streptomyces sp. CC224B]
MRAEVATLELRGPRAALGRFALAEPDVRAAGRVGTVSARETDGELRVEVLLTAFH